MPLPLRIVFHHPSDLRAGAGTRAIGLIAALRRQGWLVDAGCEDGVAESERLADNGLHSSAALHREAERLIAAWTSQRPDVVHVEVPGPESLAWRIAAKRLGLPLTTTHHRLHNWIPAHVEPGERTAVIASNQEFMLACTRVLVELPQERRELAAVGLHRLSVVGNGVDTVQFNPARRSTALRSTWQAGPTSQVLLYVGRVLPAKGLDLLSEVFAAARQEYPDCVMVVVGDGDGRAEFTRRCPWAVFTGLLRGAELATAYASGDIFLFPSRVDNYGNAVPEAMASGLACVAFDRAAAGAVIRDGHNGRLVADDAGFIAAALGLLADPAAAQRLGAEASATARTLTWDAVGVAADAAFRAALRDPAELRAPGVDPLMLVVRAALPDALPPGATALLHRGHQVRWIDPAQEPLDVRGLLVDAADLAGPWSPALARTEARLLAIHAGQVPAADPRRVGLLLTGERAADARATRLAGGLRRLGHPVELIAATEAERTWRASPPDAVHLSGPTATLAPLAKQLGIAVSTAAVPEGVDTHLYHPGQLNPDLRQAWGVPANGLVVLVLVSAADESTCAALRALAPLAPLAASSACTVVAACITAAAAKTLRAAGFTMPMVDGIPGAHLPRVLASTEIVILPGPQPTRSAILATLASGTVLALTGDADGLPEETHLRSADLAVDITALLADPRRRTDLTTAGRRYAEAHTWTDSARVVMAGLG